MLNLKEIESLCDDIDVGLEAIGYDAEQKAEFYRHLLANAIESMSPAKREEMVTLLKEELENA